MGTVYRRKDKLWIGFRDVDGEWHYKATRYRPGQEQKARKAVEAIERRIAAELGAGAAVDGPLTVRRYAERWLSERSAQGVHSASDEGARLKRHVYPVLGEVLVRELRPHHVRDLVRHLRRKQSARGGLLAPRTVRHVYATLHRALHDAVVDELIDTNPCVLKRGELPAKHDRDPTWRAGAVFTRDEVEQIISDERIPEDRRTAYALLLLGGLRFGEGSALRWSHYDASATPLGRLVVAFSYDTKKRVEKGTKTEQPRAVPVHPTLARLLAEWKLGGFARMLGRVPGADDLIVPSRGRPDVPSSEGRNRNVNHMLKRFHEDLARIGLRKRRQHDLRRTFISLALADGARKDVLRWVTHGRSGDVMDMYTTLPWPALCEEVSKLRVQVRGGQLIPFPKPAVSTE